MAYGMTTNSGNCTSSLMTSEQRCLLTPTFCPTCKTRLVLDMKSSSKAWQPSPLLDLLEEQSTSLRNVCERGSERAWEVASHASLGLLDSSTILAVGSCITTGMVDREATPGATIREATPKERREAVEVFQEVQSMRSKQ